MKVYCNEVLDLLLPMPGEIDNPIFLSNAKIYPVRFEALI